MFRAACLALALAVSPAAAQDAPGTEAVLSPRPVSETMDRLEAAVTEAGATVFARVDHGAGAMSADMELREAELLIFGNPKIGTPIMQADILAGLVLPMRVLVHERPGGSVIVWTDPARMFEGLDVPDDLPAIATLRGAVDRFVRAAAGRD